MAVLLLSERPADTKEIKRYGICQNVMLLEKQMALIPVCDLPSYGGLRKGGETVKEGGRKGK